MLRGSVAGRLTILDPRVKSRRRRSGSPPTGVRRFTGGMPSPSEEAARRRTFAIISHPDAGKTTLTEKFLLYGGALQSAGAVKARGERRRVTSDWMEMEQKRGISITSTVLQFPYRDSVLNLLDTPGHRDFSEDTYRVLAAADAAIMVLDAAKGIEPQTLKLFEVCRERNLPLLTFINKWDRPGPRPAGAARPGGGAAVDRARRPVTWPVGHRGRLPRAWSTGAPATTSASPAPPGGPPRRARSSWPRTSPRRRRATAWTAAADELGLLDEVGAHAEPGALPQGRGHAGLLRLRAHQLRRAPAARRGGRPGAVARAARRRRGPAALARRAVLGLRVQGAGEHGSVAPRPHRVRARVLGPVRARDGRHPRAHRQALRHQVRPLGVRAGARHDRGGVAGRRDRPRERHGRDRRATPSTSSRPSSSRGCPSSRPSTSSSPG